MKPIAVFKLGEPRAHIREAFGEYADWIVRGLGEGVSVCVVDVLRGEALPRVDALSAVVLSGSASMVTDREDWSEAVRTWLQQALLENLPILGICYGHQLLADAAGGEVGYNPQGLEIGTVMLTRTAQSDDDPLFAALPQTFTANVTHFQSVLTLPPDAVHLASSEQDKHHAFRIGNHAWGLQFHPEFNGEATKAHVDYREEALQKQGRTVQAVRESIHDAPLAASLLKRFGDYVGGRV